MSQSDYLDQLGSLWANSPDLPFGKFIYKALRNCTDLYFLKDSELLNLLEKAYNNE